MRPDFLSACAPCCSDVIDEIDIIRPAQDERDSVYGEVLHGVEDPGMELDDLERWTEHGRITQRDNCQSNLLR